MAIIPQKTEIGKYLHQNYRGDFTLLTTNAQVRIVDSEGNLLEPGRRVLKVGNYSLSVLLEEGYLLKNLIINGKVYEDPNCEFEIKFGEDLSVTCEGGVLFPFTFEGETITGYTGEATDIVLPSSYSIAKNGLYIAGDDYQITTVKANLFQNNTQITSIVLEEGYTVVGDYAFDGCTSLRSITLPNSLLTIGTYMCRGCTSLTSITIPENVTKVGTHAFENTKNVTTVNFQAKNCGAAGYENYIFYNCGIDTYTRSGTTIKGGVTINIADTVETIPERMFCSYNSLAIWFPVTKINIGKKVHTIGPYAFYCVSCYSSLNIPSNVKYIKSSAFGCAQEYLRSITFNEGLEEIGYHAFAAAGTFSTIYIPASVKTIGSAIFYNSDYVGDIRVDVNNPYFEDGGVGAIIEKPSSSTGKYVLKQASIKTRQQGIPDYVNTIYEYAFGGVGYGISGLSSEITIPASVTSIGYRNFYQSSINTFIVLGTTPPSLSSLNFDSGDTIYVPASALSTYKNSWSSYASQIQAITE